MSPIRVTVRKIDGTVFKEHDYWTGNSYLQLDVDGIEDGGRDVYVYTTERSSNDGRLVDLQVVERSRYTDPEKEIGLNGLLEKTRKFGFNYTEKRTQPATARVTVRDILKIEATSEPRSKALARQFRLPI